MELRRDELVRLLQDAAEEHRNEFERLKREALIWGNHVDWPWNGVVLSAATRGGSWRWDRNFAPRYETELSWDVLARLSVADRRKSLETVGRFWRRTAHWLEAVHQRLWDKGGPANARQTLAAKNSAEIIAFWKSFPNVGDKYSRNIMMDIYHPDFKNGYFAIDSRIKRLLPKLGYVGHNRYTEQEAFLAALARDVEIEGWELDRLLYQGHVRIEQALTPCGSPSDPR